MPKMRGETAQAYGERRAFEAERKNNPPQIDPAHCILEPLCTCSSWRYPHILSAHKKLRGDWEWPSIAKREDREEFRQVWDTSTR